MAPWRPCDKTRDLVYYAVKSKGEMQSKPVVSEATMRITEKVVANVTVLQVQGNLLQKDGDDTLLNEITRHLGAGCKYIVLNMLDCRNIDSSGVNVLIQCHTRITKCGGGLKFSHLSPRIVHILELTKLKEVLVGHEDDEAAVESFAEIIAQKARES